MLRQASVGELKKGEVSRERGYIVLAMRRYPRGVSKTLRDEYVAALGPPAELLDELHALKKSHSHNDAFAAARYEERFELTEPGIEALERLAELSRSRDVYLICQCKPDERCHRELLLLLAQARFRAQIAPLRFAYATYEARVGKK